MYLDAELPKELVDLNIPLTAKGKATLAGFTTPVLREAIKRWQHASSKWSSIDNPFFYFRKLCNVAAKEANQEYNVHKAPTLMACFGVSKDGPYYNTKEWDTTKGKTQSRLLSGTPPLSTDRSCDCGLESHHRYCSLINTYAYRPFPPDYRPTLEEYKRKFR